MRGLTLAGLLLVASLASAAEPKAAIVGRDRYPFGASVRLDGRKSVSDRPLIWKLKGEHADAPFDLKPDFRGRENAYFDLTTPDPGSYEVQLIAIGLPKDGKAEDINVDVDIHNFVVEDDATPPAPPPGPTPGPGPVPPGPAPGPRPAPGTAAGLGFDYGAALVNGAAATIERASAGLGPPAPDGSSVRVPWKTTSELAALMQQNFQYECTRAFASVAASLSAQSGPASDAPVDEDIKTALRTTLQGIATGLRQRGMR